jgi:predicted amidohydrolase
MTFNRTKAFKIALVQLMVTANKQDNIRNALELIGKAAKNDAKLIVLPVDHS